MLLFIFFHHLECLLIIIIIIIIIRKQNFHRQTVGRFRCCCCCYRCHFTTIIDVISRCFLIKYSNITSFLLFQSIIINSPHIIPSTLLLLLLLLKWINDINDGHSPFKKKKERNREKKINWIKKSFRTCIG